MTARGPRPGDPTDPAPAGPADRALSLLRLSMGVIWSMNLVFILAPANRFFPTFASTASSYGTTTVLGPGVANFVSAYPAIFASLIALTTAFLAASLLLGLATRWACVLGGVFSAVLLITQWNATFYFPGGTDVGPHPIYMVVYVALASANSARFYSLPAYLARRSRSSSRFGSSLPVPRRTAAPTSGRP